MAVIQVYIKSMGVSRKEYKVLWYALSVTMITHIIKVLLIVDDDNKDKWIKEIENNVEILTNKSTDANIKKDTLYKEIYQGISLPPSEIPLAVKIACDKYLKDDNKGSVKLRDYNKHELSQNINEILKGCISLVRFFKTNKIKYERHSIAQMTIFQVLIKDYHARDYTIITNPDKQVR